MYYYYYHVWPIINHHVLKFYYLIVKMLIIKIGNWKIRQIPNHFKCNFYFPSITLIFVPFNTTIIIGTKNKKKKIVGNIDDTLVTLMYWLTRGVGLVRLPEIISGLLVSFKLGPSCFSLRPKHLKIFSIYTFSPEPWIYKLKFYDLQVFSLMAANPELAASR